jgi:hypothetical protein
VPVKAGYLLLTAGGAAVAYAGFKGHRWGQVVRDLISGQKIPAAQELAITTSPAAYAYGGIGTNPNVSTPGPSGPGERAFWVAVLIGCAAPPTTSNIQSLIHWRTRESPWNNQPPDGAQYTHNPLNTTLAYGGGVSINSVGVKKYPNAAVGVAATVKTLKGYPGILSALRAGKGLCGVAPSEFSQWSGGGYSSVC